MTANDRPPPRIAPLDPQSAAGEAQQILEDWPYNLHRVLAHNVPTLTRWMPYAEHILRNNQLPEREREIAILRVAWNARSDYEWGLHARLARSLGFSDDDLAALTRASDDAHWSPVERALIQAVDDIMARWEVSDSAWAVLADAFDEAQLIDFVFVTGQFMLVAVTLKTLRVPLEDGVERLPAG